MGWDMIDVWQFSVLGRISEFTVDFKSESDNYYFAYPAFPCRTVEAKQNEFFAITCVWNQRLTFQIYKGFVVSLPLFLL